jgi:lipoyl(octanoyl) transferase
MVQLIRSLTPSLYTDTLALQQQLFDSNLLAKATGQSTSQTLILCEHLPVYTIGKSGKGSNMLFDPKAIGAELVQVGRGGDITYHGPGQLVVYPILDLERIGMGIAAYVHALEEVVIKTVAHYGIMAGRISSASGVWLDIAGSPRKICAIGIKASRYCTMHGIAININTDLKYFDHIVPCGIADKGVTSLQRELGHTVDMTEVADHLLAEMQQIMRVAIEE